jgi:hypothetical protein
MTTYIRRLRWVLALLVAGVAVIPASAAADDPPAYAFAGPVFGLAAAPDWSLLVADSGAGVVELRQGEGSLVSALPGVDDIAPIGRGSMFAITGGGGGPAGGEPSANAAKLFEVSRGSVSQVADLRAFEARVNPDGGDVDSNPFAVAAAGSQALVADAGGNDLLVVDRGGGVDWVATLPTEIVSTANLKNLAGCPAAPPELVFACALPPTMPAEAVATSVAIGPDGAYYVGELKGFPAPTGASQVWRIEPGTRHAVCGTSPACRVVASGFTSIVDLSFAPDGSLYVVEIDEASWAAVDFGLPSAGGTVNRCDVARGTCAEVASHLQMPTAAAVTRDGVPYAVIKSLIPGAAQVVALTA